jgi:hypothetical protein
MRKILLIILLCGINCIATMAQTTDDKKVAEAVETLRKTLIDPDKTVLDKIIHEDLSYGHSGGNIETKAMLIESLMTGVSDFKTIELTDQTIKVHGKTAIVRHKLSAETNNRGVAGTVKLSILYVFQKVKGEWQMLARQAVKIP